MQLRVLVLGVALVLVNVASAWSDPSDVTHHQLSLFGYQIGMSYDDAVMVRPFHRVENLPKSQAGSDSVAIIESLPLDEFEFRLTVYFLENRVAKVIGRFVAVQADRMLELCRTAYGPAEDLSRVTERYDGVTLEQFTYLWTFPKAKVYLVKSSGHNPFAVLSMLSRRPPPADEAETNQP